ncbi:MAG: class I SAM-dependent methyltransferase [Thermoleophilia bacterium]
MDGNIPVFEPDQLGYRDYEGWWTYERPFEELSRGRRLLFHHLRYWPYRERRFFDRHIKAASVMLDIGCWGGNGAIAAQGTVVGIDLSLDALKRASQVYDLVVQGNIRSLPFADESFDCVFSSHVLGHLTAEEKDGALGEIFRVTKPGGQSLHIVETDSNGRLASRAKLQPELYQKYFIDRYGHIGLERASTVIDRFEAQGFVLEDVTKMDCLCPPPWYYEQYFDNEYARQDPVLARKLCRSQWLSSTRASRLALGFAWGLFHSSWEQWLGRLDASMHISIHVRKPDGNLH